MSRRSLQMAASAARRVFLFAFPGLLWGPRARWVALLLGWPFLLAVLSALTGRGRLPWTGAADGLYLEWLLPLAALVQATRLIRDEVEAGTIVYLLSRPIPRTAILAGEWTAYFAASVAVAWAGLGLGYLLSPAAEVSFGRTLGTVAAALAAYGALFTFLGLILRRPLVAGLLVLAAQWLVMRSGLLPRLPLTSYLQTLAGATSAPPEISTTLAAAVLGLFTGAFLAASAVAFEQGEYVPEA